jgi:hypothetical protein
MSKKKLKKMLRKALEKEIGRGRNGAAEYEDDAPGAGSGDDAGRSGSYQDGKGSNGRLGAAGQGLLRSLGLPRGLGAGTTEQFVVGALLGAAAAYVLADEELRGKIMKSALRLYTGLAGSVEEFKEQMADVRAEIEAERGA